MRRSEVALALACAACAHGAPQVPREAPAKETAVRSYDLVPRNYDPNGFSLDPEFGWWFNRRMKCGGGGEDPDPSACSWRFQKDAVLPQGLDACNTRLLDPDLSDHWSTWLVGITCSDSPLLYTGHLNWGEAYGGAVTYGGTLSWQEYATNDHDLNFYFEPENGPSPGFAIGVEIDQRDVAGFHAPWFVGLNEAVFKGGRKAPAAWVGRRKAVVTGLLGIDAEHLSARSLNVELHPVFAMAVQTATTAKREVWTLFARDGGNEGFCSHQGREHVLKWPQGEYRVELPLDCQPAALAAHDPSSREPGVTTSMRSDREGASSSVMIDRTRALALVTIAVPEGGTVEGEVTVQCKGRHNRAAPSPARPPPGVAIPLDRRSLGTAEEGEDLQQKIARICAADPAACEGVFGDGEFVKAVPNTASTFGGVPARTAPALGCGKGLPAPFIAPQDLARPSAARSLTAAPPPAPPEHAAAEREARPRRSVKEKICARKDETSSRLCAVLRQGR
ncbi:MAG TPA: hypothetical protein VFL36_07485 [Myxococcales bacterium]|nr:hypothetical protein [Myxococcales bacterium]